MARRLKEAAKQEVQRRLQDRETFAKEFPDTLDDTRAQELAEFIFRMGKHWKQFEQTDKPRLLKEHASLRKFHTELVPDEVSDKEFWTRYFYWCSEKRWIRELQRQSEEDVKYAFHLPDEEIVKVSRINTITKHLWS